MQPEEIILGSYYRCIKTVKEQNLRKGQVWLYDYTSPNSQEAPMLIRDLKSGMSNMLLNGRWLLRQPGWFESAEDTHPNPRLKALAKLTKESQRLGLYDDPPNAASETRGNQAPHSH